MPHPIETLTRRYRGLVSELPVRGQQKFRVTIVPFDEDEPELRGLLDAVIAQGGAARIAVYGGDPDEDVEAAAQIACLAADEEWIDPYENQIVTTHAFEGPNVFTAAPALAELLAYLARHYATEQEVQALFPEVKLPDPRDELPPLQRAAAKGELAALEELLAAGASLARTAMDMSPLQLAIQNRQAAVVKRLLAAGAPVDETDGGGFTLLHAAVIANDVEIVRALLDAGRDPGRETVRGTSPIDAARERPDRAAVLELLLAAQRQ